MIFEKDVRLLVHEGFDRDNIQDHPEVFEELLGILNELDSFRTLMNEVRYVIMTMHADDGLTTVEALKWILTFSRYLEDVPIQYLIKHGPRGGEMAVILAADAHMSDLKGMQAQATKPGLPPNNVISLGAVRASKQKKR